MRVLVINEYQTPVTQNLIHHMAELLGDDFRWTGWDSYRADFLPMSPAERGSYVREPDALTDVAAGRYDAVVFSEGSKLVFFSQQLRSAGAMRVMVDASDVPYIPRFYAENSDVYFKCQLRRDASEVRNGNEEQGVVVPGCDYEARGIYPLPLMPAYKLVGDPAPLRGFAKNFDAFFAGSAWPRDRVAAIGRIKERSEINFFGGLFNRSDLNFNTVVPDGLLMKRISPADHAIAMEMSRVCLSLRGNGENCFRQYEIMAAGSFLLMQRTGAFWGAAEPKDGEHLVYASESLDDVVDKVVHYSKADAERERVAAAGRRFFMEHYHPRVVAADVVEKMRRHYKEFDR